MTTGFMVGDRCYSTNAEANDAFYTAQPVFQTSGSTSYVNTFIKVGTSWNLRQYSVSSTGIWTTRSTTLSPTFSFPSCDVLPPVADLATAFGGGFILPMAAFVLAYAVGRINAMFSNDR